MLGALIVVSLLTAAALAAGVYDRADHRRHIQHLLAAQDAERWSWQRERWELMTRLQSPEIARYAPPPPPAAPGRPGVEQPPLPFDEEPDESNLIGTVVGREPEA
ncbi:MAG TPA: hypothetical protein VFT50_09335 [Baekduia sp.]|nr:hypothetical protein [Baekduia sp.]